MYVFSLLRPQATIGRYLCGQYLSNVLTGRHLVFWFLIKQKSFIVKLFIYPFSPRSSVVQSLPILVCLLSWLLYLDNQWLSLTTNDSGFDSTSRASLLHFTWRNKVHCASSFQSHALLYFSLWSGSLFHPKLVISVGESAIHSEPNGGGGLFGFDVFIPQIFFILLGCQHLWSDSKITHLSDCKL